MPKLAGWIVAGMVCAWSGMVSAQATASATQAKPAQVVSKADAEPNADPAVWKVQGPHETVYLFGTVHVMKPDVRWHTKKVTDAFAKSDTLYLEVASLNDMAAMQPLVMKMGIDQEHPLSTKISAEDKAALDKAIKGMSMPGEQMLEPMQPWLAYMTLSVMPILKSGYSPASGVDMVISKDATDANKTVVGFETMEQQLHYLADFPHSEQVTLLHDQLQDLPTASTQMNEMMSAWTKGDVETIAKIENAGIAKSPELYKKLVVQRNQRFADEIAKLLAGTKPGTVFVAVGAAHLAGPDSVQKDLEAKGFKVTRE